MHKKNVHVFHADGKWVVEQEGQPNVKTAYATRFAAVIAAKKLAKQNRSNLIIHRVDGSVAQRNTYIPGPVKLELSGDQEEVETA